MDATKNDQQEPHEGFGDGDDDDPEDRLAQVMLALSLAGDLLAICASARAHGIEYAHIRQAFEGGMTQLVEAERALARVAEGTSVDDALETVRVLAKKRIDQVMIGGAPDDTKKSS